MTMKRDDDDDRQKNTAAAAPLSFYLGPNTTIHF